MAYDIDAWFPNFTLFTLILAPIVLLVMFVMVALVRLGKLPAPAPLTGGRFDFVTLIGLIPLVYIALPLWEIMEYLTGERDIINDRLWDEHLPIVMELIIYAGIIQVLYILYATAKARKSKGVKA